MLQEIPIILKKVSNKNCSELNFLQKNSVYAYLCLQFMCISIPPPPSLSGARGLQRLSFYVPEWESRFTLEMNAAKNTDYIDKFFK